MQSTAINIKMHTVRIATWKANDSQNHVPELKIFLQNHKIDICFTSKTH